MPIFGQRFPCDISLLQLLFLHKKAKILAAPALLAETGLLSWQELKRDIV